jgi:hypothetical protein
MSRVGLAVLLLVGVIAQAAVQPDVAEAEVAPASTVTMNAANPTSGPAGRSVTLSAPAGTFDAGSPVTFSFASTGLTSSPSPCTARASNPNIGSVSCSVELPDWAGFGSSTGAKTIDVSGTKSTAAVTGTVTYTVVSPTTTAQSGPKGATVTVAGSGFALSQTVAITLGGDPVTTCSTTSAGALTGCSVTIASVGSTGARSYTVTDAKGNFATWTYTVAAPTATASPVSGPPGATVTIGGSGFLNADGNSVIVYGTDGTTALTTCSVRTSGSPGAIANGCTVTVPVGATPGLVGYPVTDSYGNTATAAFTIESPPAVTQVTIDATASSPAVPVVGGVYPGTVITVDGSSFSAANVVATTGSGGSRVAWGDCVATGSGSEWAFDDCALTVPTNFPAGSVSITFTSGSGGSAKSATATLLVLAPSAPSDPGTPDSTSPRTTARRGFVQFAWDASSTDVPAGVAVDSDPKYDDRGYEIRVRYNGGGQARLVRERLVSDVDDPDGLFTFSGGRYAYDFYPSADRVGSVLCMSVRTFVIVNGVKSFSPAAGFPASGKVTDAAVIDRLCGEPSGRDFNVTVECDDRVEPGAAIEDRFFLREVITCTAVVQDQGKANAIQPIGTIVWGRDEEESGTAVGSFRATVAPESEGWVAAGPVTTAASDGLRTFSGAISCTLEPIAPTGGGRLRSACSVDYRGDIVGWHGVDAVFFPKPDDPAWSALNRTFDPTPGDPDSGDEVDCWDDVAEVPVDIVEQPLCALFANAFFANLVEGEDGYVDVGFPLGETETNVGYDYRLELAEKLATAAPITGVKAGGAVPFIFRVTDAHGVPVTTLPSVIVHEITWSGDRSTGTLVCPVDGPSDDDLRNISARAYFSGRSGLQNLGDGWYQVNVKTSKTAPGECFRASYALNLSDASTHHAVRYPRVDLYPWDPEILLGAPMVQLVEDRWLPLDGESGPAYLPRWNFQHVQFVASGEVRGGRPVRPGTTNR